MDLVWAPYEIETPEAEFKFHPSRRWKFDFCFVRHRIAVEIEGAIWTQGRHTRGSGFLKDMEKYNEAGRLGYRVFRFTPQQLRKGEAQEFMRTVLL